MHEMGLPYDVWIVVLVMCVSNECLVHTVMDVWIEHGGGQCVVTQQRRNTDIYMYQQTLLLI